MKNTRSLVKIFAAELVVFSVSAIGFIYVFNHFLSTKYTLEYVLLIIIALFNASLLAYGIWQSLQQKQWTWTAVFTLCLSGLVVGCFYMMVAITLSGAFQDIGI